MSRNKEKSSEVTKHSNLSKRSNIESPLPLPTVNPNIKVLAFPLSQAGIKEKLQEKIRRSEQSKALLKNKLEFKDQLVTAQGTSNQKVDNLALMKNELRRKVSPAATNDDKTGGAATQQKPDSPGLKLMKTALRTKLSPDFSSGCLSLDQEFDAIVGTLNEDFPGYSCQLLCIHESSSSKRYFEITRSYYDILPPNSNVPWKGARVVLCSAGWTHFEAMGKVIDSTKAKADLLRAALLLYLDKLQPGYSFCLGINNLEFSDTQRHNAICIHETFPIETWRHIQCQRWVKGKSDKLQCRQCFLALKAQAKAELRSREKEQKVVAKRNLRYCHRSQLINQHRKLMRKLSQRTASATPINVQTPFEVEICDDQSTQLAEAAELIKNEYHKDLENTFTAIGHGCGSEFEKICRNAWNNDQMRNTTGTTGNRWSMITLRVCLAILVRSPSAYRALSQFPILKLPSERQLKRVIEAEYSSGQGPDQQYLQAQSVAYDQAQAGKKLPGCKVGALIVDECQVVAKMCMNSKSKEIYGSAASAEQLSSLVDVYKEFKSLSNNQPAQYVLQTLWRDVTSNFDMIGPYYLSEKTVDKTFLWSVLYETMRIFSAYGFKTELLVCDGASSNLALIKELCAEHSGAYGVGKVNSNSNDEFSVPCSFPNPFCPGSLVWCIICPSHMLKNYINALHSSCNNGAKNLKLNEDRLPFGWNVIWNLWEREMERRGYHSQRVPKLTESDVKRDSWTKLRVQPALIFIGEEVISELKEQLVLDPDNKQIADTILFLEAGRKLFRNGLLSHKPVNGLDCEPITNMLDGFQFIKDWYKCLELQENFKPISHLEKRFISWQTFDLLRISLYGMIGFIGQFTEKFPKYYLLLFRINGSGVETVFAQIRQRAGAAVTSVNYAPSLAKLKVSQNCDLNRKRKDQYRDDQLMLHTDFKRKK